VRLLADRPAYFRAARSLLALACALSCFTTAGWAQVGTASLEGRITDAQGGVLPGASVTLSSSETATTRSAVTDETGGFAFIAVPPGVYQVKVELQGFRTGVLERVALRVDTASKVDLSLEVGSLAETVEVQAEVPVINRSDASLGNVIDGTQIRELPLEARNVAGLLSLQPGVTFVPTNNMNTQDDRFGSVDPRNGAVSGARADQQNVTLDGIDVNDAQKQSPFTSVLRVTLDSVQEFRVSTANFGADQGQSSGAQVSLVTRGGTNDFHGSGYWVNRDTEFSANEYFLKLTQLSQDQPSEAPLLNKNIYGFSLGGPVKRDKFFFFGNFEALDEQRENPVTRNVPSAAFRDGVLIYQCATPSACPGGSVRGLTGSHPVPAGSYGMTPDELRRVDPLHIGPNLAALEYFRQFPLPNEDGNYPGNIDFFRFAAGIDNQFRTYIGRVDFRATPSQSFFGRLNFQDDAVADVPQYPGKPPNEAVDTNNRGFAIGHDWVVGTNKVNTLRYGYTFIDEITGGVQSADGVTFRFIDPFDSLSDSFGRELGTHNIVNDFSWIRGRHSWKFGGNARWIDNQSFDNENSFNVFSSNPSWVPGSGTRYMPGGACPAPADCSGLPAVASASRSNYSDPFVQLLGVLSQNEARYNFNIDGSLVPPGEPVLRHYAAEEYELYVQDTWRVRDNLSVTAGLRYSLFSPPYEANGVQVAPSPSLGEWFAERERNMVAGVPSNASPLISFVPAGPKNDGPGFYDWDYNNFGPRVAVAWTPTPKTVVRGGYSIVYDRLGAGLATSFDRGGSFGLATQLGTPFGTLPETNAGARFRGISASYPHLLEPAPPGGFPQTPDVFAGEIGISIDDTIVTPYSHVFNVVLGRELGSGFGVEAAFVGRIGRNQLVRRDMAMPLNLVDPATGLDYFTAVRQLLDASADGVDGMAPIAYWENLFPDAAGGGLSATQAMAQSFQDNAPDYITALWLADEQCDPACSRFGEFAYFARQYDSLAARSSVGRSKYNAMQLSLRKRFSAGYQFDVNYTLAEAKDHASEVEIGGTFGNFGSGGYSGFLVNTWDPDLNYSTADYDVRHQININWLTELPFGQGRPLGGNVSGPVNAIIGDWALAGILRWTSGFPFNVINCRSCWPTNWNLQGNAELVTPGRLPETERTRNVVDGRPSPFTDPAEAITFFRNAYPGEIGLRNALRGDGYFGVDFSLSKGFAMPFGHRLRFRWDVFNLTNTPRFDTGDVEMLPDRATTFGRYNAALATCDGAAGRCMQANLRYEW
jgi:hypothetical protein